MLPCFSAYFLAGSQYHEERNGRATRCKEQREICAYFPSSLGQLSLYSYYETVLVFGIYTVLEIVPCNEIHLDELSGQSYEEIKETLFTTTTTTTRNCHSLDSKIDFANQKIFECKLVSKKAKLKLELIIIRLVITYTYANNPGVLK